MVAIGWRKRKVVNKNKLSVEEYLILKQSLDEITPTLECIGLTDEETIETKLQEQNNGT
jgi:hypothetical protein